MIELFGNNSLDEENVKKNNIIKYGNASLCGKIHADCQDYSLSKIIGERYCLLVVADGVGSASMSAIGSKKVCEVIDEYVCLKIINKINEFNNYLDNEYNIEMLSVLRQAYKKSLKELKELSERENMDVEEYATTLTVLIYSKEYVYWGHCGDGGIIGIYPDGKICEITTEQSGMRGGEVFPLHSGEEYWSFGIEKSEASSYFLFTDGMLNNIKKIASKENSGSYFYNLLNGLNKGIDIKISQYVEKIITQKNITTTDDKSMSVVFDSEKEIPLADEYYFLDKDNNYYIENYDFVENLSFEEFIQKYCKNSEITIEPDKMFVISIISGRNETVYRIIYSKKKIFEICDREGLYNCIDLMIDMSKYSEVLLKTRIEGTEIMKIEDVLEVNNTNRVYYAENILDTKCMLYEYKDFIVSDIYISNFFFNEGYNIDVMMSYMYQLGKQLYLHMKPVNKDLLNNLNVESLGEMNCNLHDFKSIYKEFLGQ